MDVYVDGNKIPTVNHPKILGVTFDSLFSFSAHASATCENMRARNKVLQSLAGSTCGADKETLLTTYKAIGRSVANYAPPVWTAGTSDTQWRNLQKCQNAALRTATGCHLMSSEHHLHQESQMLALKEHNTLLSKQFLVGCHRGNHPNNALLRTHALHAGKVHTTPNTSSHAPLTPRP
ncbi:PREDICTED: uncharacterized protein LOC108379925 [Rhagoletis zephyria]|uniref:uncharacterized protein LOC108379925 n=1 Tax=Rhagoletis zephyria TaxID=28612 RepID=UPI000811797E|nr:PREDICTED: uncharacterized protein LOC108379925 [Rhagoletis zephyria]